MSDGQAKGRDVAALGAVAAVACCGIPLLLAAGASISFLGIGLRSWLVLAAGAVIAVVGWSRARRRRPACEDVPLQR